LRWKHAPGILRQRISAVCDLRQELLRQSHPEDCEWRQLWRLQLDGSAHVASRAADEWYRSALLHIADRQLERQRLGYTIWRRPMAFDTPSRAAHGRTGAKAQRDYGQIRSAETH